VINNFIKISEFLEISQVLILNFLFYFFMLSIKKKQKYCLMNLNLSKNLVFILNILKGQN